MLIVDNYLPETSHQAMRNYLLSPKPNWTYNSYKVNKKESTDSFQFTHTFYRCFKRGKHPVYADIGVVQPLLEKIEPEIILKIKANITPRTAEPDKTDFHTDFCPLMNSTTAIYYINSNNGYTEFETGEVVESVAHRIVFFKVGERHRGVSCTDAKSRVVLNLNFFPRVLT